MVIPGNRNHPAMPRSARHIRVFEHIRATIHTRPLAIPDAKDAIELFALRIQVELLRAPNRSRTEFFIDPRLKHNVLRCQMLFGRPQSLVITTQRRAAIATDKARRIQPSGCIPHPLQHRQPDEGLHPAHESAAGGQRVFVVQRYSLQCAAHGFGQGCIHGGVSLGFVQGFCLVGSRQARASRGNDQGQAVNAKCMPVWGKPV